MAKAQFHKNQRVYVKPVGTWAVVERVLPQWAKGLDEPIRVFYDVGLGRDFGPDELQREGALSENSESFTENWRIIRGRNKWQQPEDCGHHPHPGTYPILVTSDSDWGGWRVPGSEYDLDPDRIEMQARIMSSGLRMLGILQSLLQFVSEESSNLPDDILALAKDADEVRRYILDMSNPEAASEAVVDDELAEEADISPADASAA